MYWLNKPSGEGERRLQVRTILIKQGGNATIIGTVCSLHGFATSHSFVDELFTGVKISLEDEAVVQMGEHGMFQRYPSLLLERLEGLCVVMLSEVFEAKADGFLFSVLQRERRVIRILGRTTAAHAHKHQGGGGLMKSNPEKNKNKTTLQLACNCM